MAATASFSVSGRITGTPTGHEGPVSITVGAFTLTSNDACAVSLQPVLASGDNTITVPQLPAATGVIISLHEDNTQEVILKGHTDDVGVSLGKTGATMITWEAANAPADFILDSAGVQTGLTTQIVFF